MLKHDLERHPSQDLPLQSEDAAEQIQRTSPDGSNLYEPRIEDYLDKVFAPLAEAVPYEKRRELRQEIRSHLDTMIEAHEELGSGREEAVEFALKQFGRPKLIGKRWRNTWLDAQQSFRSSFRYALRAAGISTALYCLHFPIVQILQERCDIYVAMEIAASEFAIFIIVPLLSGFITGWHRQRRPMLAALTAQAVAAACAAPLLTCIYAFIQLIRYGSTIGIFAIFLEFMFFGAFMAPLAAIGAGLGKFFRRGRVKALVE